MPIRVVAYVDGFNLYHGLRAKGWRRFYWLNIQALARQLLKPGQTLTATKYFTTIVKRPEDSRLRQAVFLEALQTLPDFHIQYGHFMEDTVTCRQCGHTYATHHEKMTDVNLSVELMTDAFQDRFDLALVVSADSDLVGPLRAVRQLFSQKRFLVAFPPERSSAALKKAAHATLHIGHNELSKSLFPPMVTKADGVVLERPAGWGGEPAAKSPEPGVAPKPGRARAARGAKNVKPGAKKVKRAVTPKPGRAAKSVKQKAPPLPGAGSGESGAPAKKRRRSRQRGAKRAGRGVGKTRKS